MMVLFQHHDFFGVDPTAFMTIAKLGISEGTILH